MTDEKKVFGPYWNGQKEVYADPLTVYRRLVSACQGEPNSYLADARGPDPLKRARAWDTLLPAALAALDMVPFDPATGAGAREVEVRAALADFLRWVQSKKGSGPTRATCSPCTAPPATSTGIYPTLTGSGCGSTSPGSGGGGPGK